MDTGLGKPRAESPEATVHAPQVGDAAGRGQGPEGAPVQLVVGAGSGELLACEESGLGEQRRQTEGRLGIVSVEVSPVSNLHS